MVEFKNKFWEMDIFGFQAQSFPSRVTLGDSHSISESGFCQSTELLQN